MSNLRKRRVILQGNLLFFVISSPFLVGDWPPFNFLLVFTGVSKGGVSVGAGAVGASKIG